MDHKFLNARRQARRLGMQALYQWQLAKTDLNDLEKQFKEQEEFKKADPEYFRELLRKIPEHQEQLSEILSGYTTRPIKDIDPVELSVLYIALYELKHRLDIPFKVVINEAVSLTRKFGAEDGHKYVNGILDKAAKELRAIELKTAR